MRIAVAPVLAENPYQQILERELEALGATFEHPRRLTLRWALRTSVAVLHLHWIEYLTGSHATESLHRPRVALRTARLFAVLLVLRARGVRLVWTVHNLRPHDARHPRFDLVVARLVARLAHRLIAHSRYAAQVVQRTYGVGDVSVAYHGGYEDQYRAEGVDRAAARLRLGLPEDAHVVLAFGLIRAYKRIPELIARFRDLIDPDRRLVVAGRPASAGLEAEVRAAAADDRRVILMLSHIPDDQVAELHLAADVAVLAYRDVFSSGALMLALSLGVPVVAPQGSTADELAGPPAVEPYVGTDVGGALARTKPIDRDAARRAALEAARRFPWSAAARTVMACYRGD
ncbi:MAG TPA: glycosyltransferase [Solirubrobacteraceae bacterium]